MKFAMKTGIFIKLFLLMMPRNTYEEDVFRPTGGEIEMSVKSSGLIKRLLWRYGDNKLAEWEVGDKTPEYFGIYENRTSLDVKTGSVKIRHLTKSDNARYSVEINGTSTETKYTLTVMDPVNKPKVTCQENSTSVTLLCSGDNRPTTQYSWEGPDIAPQTGSQLKMEAAESSDSVYTCVLKNPVSENRTDFPVKSCFPEPDNSAVGVGVGVALLVLAVIVAAVLGYLYIKKKKGKGEICPKSTESPSPIPDPPAANDVTLEMEKQNVSNAESSKPLLENSTSANENEEEGNEDDNVNARETGQQVANGEGDESSKPEDNSAPQEEAGKGEICPKSTESPSPIPDPPAEEENVNARETGQQVANREGDESSKPEDNSAPQEEAGSDGFAVNPNQ